MYEAHLTLLYLLGMEQPGTILTMDFKSFRVNKLKLAKNPDCPACQSGQSKKQTKRVEAKMNELLSIEELQAHDHLIVDVRTAGEIEADPIEGALHMELTTIPSHHEQLPKDKLLAFVCAGNVRSVQAANYLAHLGYNNVCVLDKFSL